MYMNLETDLPERMLANRKMRERGRQVASEDASASYQSCKEEIAAPSPSDCGAANAVDGMRLSEASRAAAIERRDQSATLTPETSGTLTPESSLPAEMAHMATQSDPVRDGRASGVSLAEASECGVAEASVSTFDSSLLEESRASSVGSSLRFAADDIAIELISVGLSQSCHPSLLGEDDYDDDHHHAPPDSVLAYALPDAPPDVPPSAKVGRASACRQPLDTSRARRSVSSPIFTALPEAAAVCPNGGVLGGSARGGSGEARARARSRDSLFVRRLRANHVAGGARSNEVIWSPLQNVNLRLAQGRLYAVVGSHSSGKSSLLRLLGKAVHPTHGEVFIPPHLSIIHVEQEPQLLRHMTLLENITLGYKHTLPPFERIVEVCDALGLAPKWIQHLRDDHAEQEERERTRHSFKLARDEAARGKSISVALRAEVGIDLAEQSLWQDLLSATDRRVLQLARALLTNPHVLVLHRPLASLDEDVAARVLQGLRRFVDFRSVYGDSRPASLLSRTVFFTTSTLDEHALEAADDVIVVGNPLGGATLLHDGMLQGEDGRPASPEGGSSPESSPQSRPEVLRRICSDTEANRAIEGAPWMQPALGGGAVATSATEDDEATTAAEPNGDASKATHSSPKLGAPATAASRPAIGGGAAGGVSLVSHAEQLVMRNNARRGTLGGKRAQVRRSSIDLESLL